MRRDVQIYIVECSTCQQSKYLAQSPAGLLQPLPIADQVQENISLNFIEGLPISKDFNTIFVVVDRLTKYSHFIPLRHPFSATSVASVFARGVVRLHGIPRSIVSIKDKIFLSLFWEELFRLQSTQLKHSTTAFHPKSMGKRKQLIDASKHICNSLSAQDPNSGQFGSLGQSFDTIHNTTRQRE